MAEVSFGRLSRGLSVMNKHAEIENRNSLPLLPAERAKQVVKNGRARTAADYEKIRQ